MGLVAIGSDRTFIYTSDSIIVLGFMYYAYVGRVVISGWRLLPDKWWPLAVTGGN